ncbi:MAG: hypothetical protein IPM99_01645 [Rubrivivax sp.]|nr:hypothetical protein [Rubrivivax sp.]
MALCVPSLPFLLVGELPGERWLSARDGHALQFALLGAALLAADVLLPIPSSIVGTMLGARLGFGAGFAAAFAGMMLGQTLAYAASRHLLRHRRDTLPAAPTLAMVFLSRPVPVLAEAVALAAGAARLGWPQFVLACGAQAMRSMPRRWRSTVRSCCRRHRWAWACCCPCCCPWPAG